MSTQYGRPEDMTKQCVFDKIAAHMMKQGGKCLDDKGHCNYRNAEGKACAAGCLLTDEEALDNTEWEGKCPLDLEFCLWMVVRAQHLHDNQSVDNWPKGLHKIARDYDLDPSIILQCERGGELENINIDEVVSK